MAIPIVCRFSPGLSLTPPALPFLPPPTPPPQALKRDLDQEIRKAATVANGEGAAALAYTPPHSAQNEAAGGAAGAQVDGVEEGNGVEEEPLPELVVLTLDQDYDQVRVRVRICVCTFVASRTCRAPG